jgi:hypothetical protein
MRHQLILFLAAYCLINTGRLTHANESLANEGLLVEAESFSSYGGWKLDTQFIETMGSPYLLAHGLGNPVKNAKTSVKFPAVGIFHIFVRTKDWTARWNREESPGQFQISINGRKVETRFGTQGSQWHWQNGGTVEITQRDCTISLHDLTGFDGRCDAIYFSKKLQSRPPAETTILSDWRRTQLGLAKKPTLKQGYDLVVVGGGYSGMGSAISAARMGCKVALIQNRPVLGGNGSSEVRVWAQGHIRRGKFPRIGEIVDEFQDHAKKSPGTFEEFGDSKKEKIVRAENNIDLFLNHHAYQVDTQGEKITSIYAFDTRTSEHKEFRGRNFVDCTGHGTIGFLAGANWEITPQGRMGMSNMWRWKEEESAVEFPKTPWALDLTMKDFPYPRDHHGQWFWEGGFDKDPIHDAEGIRDWNFRAVYGAFNAMKNRDGREKHRNASLTWMAYIGGPRESRRLMGDIVLTQDDVVTKRDFDDGCVPSTWTIDLHYPKKQYAIKYPDNPFISIAKHDSRIDRTFGYPVPYRCFYSRNIDNLFMAGRCISVTHEALGTTRVMKTCGMMGEVVGKAASICALKDCTPRDVHLKHLDQLKMLLELPGKARRDNLTAKLVMPAKLALTSPFGPPTGLVAKTLPGLVVDDQSADRFGPWTNGTGLKGYVGFGYRYASPDSGAKIVFDAKVKKTANYDVRISYQPHENRGSEVPVQVSINGQNRAFQIDMKQGPTQPHGFHSLGIFSIKAESVCQITIGTTKAGGIVHADAIQLVELKK